MMNLSLSFGGYNCPIWSEQTLKTMDEFISWCPKTSKPSTTKHNKIHMSWWRHRMETFSALLAICAGHSPLPGEFPTQRPVTRSFDVYFDLRPDKRLSKQSWGWWFEALSHSLWRHRNVYRVRRSNIHIFVYTYHIAYILRILRPNAYSVNH